LASGVLEASSLVSVGAEVSGTIKAVHVELGDSVAEGDLIAEIDSLNQENAVKSAEAALAGIVAQQRNQEAVLVQARSSLERQQQLSASSLVSQTDLEAAQAAAQAAEAQLDQLAAQITQAELTVDSARLDLSRTRIVAPRDGTVVALLVDEGQTVNASSSIPTIVKIANLDTMVIKAEISEADVVKVEPGQRVYFTIMGEPERKIDATLREVEPAPNSIAEDSSDSSEAVYYNGLFEVANPDHELRISMTAEVTIVLDEASDVLTLPSNLVARRGRDGGVMVTVFDPATEEVQPRRIEVGLNNNVTAEVISGLDEGEQVVSGMGTAAAAGNGGAVRPQGGGPAGGLGGGPAGGLGGGPAGGMGRGGMGGGGGMARGGGGPPVGVR